MARECGLDVERPGFSDASAKTYGRTYWSRDVIDAWFCLLGDVRVFPGSWVNPGRCVVLSFPGSMECANVLVCLKSANQIAPDIVGNLQSDTVNTALHPKAVSCVSTFWNSTWGLAH